MRASARHSACVAAAVLLLCQGSWAAPADKTAASNIFVCVDSQGRHISADRQVDDCRNQPQRVLDGSGVTRKVLEPEVSPAEKEAEAERRRARALAEFHRKSRDRADTELLIRYPTVAAHETARKDALEQPQTIIRLAQVRIADLEDERTALRKQAAEQGTAFGPVTPKLANALKVNEEAIASQQRLIDAQSQERMEINKRFDDESARLLSIRRAQHLN